MLIAILRRTFLAAAIAFPLSAQAEPPSVQADADFQGITYTLSSSGKVSTYVGARDIGGKLGICGLVFFEKANATTRALEGRFAEHLQFKIGGRPVNVLTDFFTRYATEAEARKTGKAGCSTTNRAWDPALAKAKLEIALPPTTVFY